MITEVRRQGGWRWLTVLLVSCLVVMVAGWRLAAATDRADEQLVALADASAATPNAPTPVSVACTWGDPAPSRK